MNIEKLASILDGWKRGTAMVRQAEADLAAAGIKIDGINAPAQTADAPKRRGSKKDKSEGVPKARVGRPAKTDGKPVTINGETGVYTFDSSASDRSARKSLALLEIVDLFAADGGASVAQVKSKIAYADSPAKTTAGNRITTALTHATARGDLVATKTDDGNRYLLSDQGRVRLQKAATEAAEASATPTAGEPASAGVDGGAVAEGEPEAAPAETTPAEPAPAPTSGKRGKRGATVEAAPAEPAPEPVPASDPDPLATLTT